MITSDYIINAGLKLTIMQFLKSHSFIQDLCFESLTIPLQRNVRKGLDNPKINCSMFQINLLCFTGAPAVGIAL